MKSLLATATAIIVGFFILTGYFLPLPIITSIQSELLGWAIILSAVAMLIGIINLVSTHFRKIINRNQKDYFSIILVASFLITLIAGLILSPGDQRFQHIVTSIQIPIESSLLAMLSIVLVYTSIFIFKNKKNYVIIVFLISIIVFLTIQLLSINIDLQIPVINNLIDFISKIPMAGARGILLGIAIGSLATGLRILLGADRPYRG